MMVNEQINEPSPLCVKQNTIATIHSTQQKYYITLIIKQFKMVSENLSLWLGCLKKLNLPKNKDFKDNYWQKHHGAPKMSKVQYLVVEGK